MLLVLLAKLGGFVFWKVDRPYWMVEECQQQQSIYRHMQTTSMTWGSWLKTGFLALPHNQLLTILDPRRIIYNHSLSWATLMYLRVTVIFFREAVVLSFHVWTRKPNESGALFPGIRPWLGHEAPLHLTSYELFLQSALMDYLQYTGKNQEMGKIKTTMHAQGQPVTSGVSVSAE